MQSENNINLEQQGNRKKGYIRLYRSMMNHWIWIEKPFSKFEAWVWLLLHANFKDTKVNLGFELYPVKRGQFITSQEKMADHFGWSRHQIRSFLNLLQADRMITYATTTRFTMITICEYDAYQSDKPAKKQQADSHPTSTRHQPATDKNSNNDKNEKNDKHNPVVGVPSDPLFLSIQNLFGFTEIKHASKLFQIGALINNQNSPAKFQHFKEQIAGNIAYKTKEKIHSFPAFISGAWDQENWAHKLKDYKKNPPKGTSPVQIKAKAMKFHTPEQQQEYRERYYKTGDGHRSGEAQQMGSLLKVKVDKIVPPNPKQE